MVTFKCIQGNVHNVLFSKILDLYKTREGKYYIVLLPTLWHEINETEYERTLKAMFSYGDRI